jgi:hypothetical protein
MTMASRRVPTLADPRGSLPLAAVRATVELLFDDDRWPPHLILVEQCSASENRGGTTPSGPVAAWLRDAAGFRVISEAERLEFRSREPQTPFTQVQFFTEPDGGHVVMSVVSGPHAGHGGRYQVATGPAGPVLVGRGDWVS